MPSEKKLLEALDKDTIDTSRWTTGNAKDNKHFFEVAEGKAYGVAVPQENGTLRAWHVTDDPGKVLELLRTKGDFYAREGDLCGGLYVSAVPHYWEGRSQKKWDFLPRLTPEARMHLYSAIEDRLAEEIKSGYITQNEYASAMQAMSIARDRDYWQVLDIVVNQPYNIDVINISKNLGLAAPFQPPHIQVDFVGRYLEFNTSRAIEANEALLKLKHGSTDGLTRKDLCDMLKEYGWDGVYTKSSMGTSPELVIWNGDRVVAFGDYSRSGASLSGPRSPTAIFDPFGEHQFEARISASRGVADIQDNERKLVIPALNKAGVEQFRDVTLRIFEGDYVTGLDSRSKKFLEELDPLELHHLLGLLDKVVEHMQP